MEFVFFLAGAVAGFVTGFLVFRNNSTKIKELEQKLKDIKDNS